MSSIIVVAQPISISTALINAGGIATLSLFDVPELQAQPASRSLPTIRWLFSRGSHIFPQAALLSSASFAYLAYATSPSVGGGTTFQMLNHEKVRGYIVAALLTISIGPFTGVMVPTNFRIIQKNEEKGGARSQKSAEENSNQPGAKSADESVAGKDQPNQFTDLSNPSEKTKRSTSDAEDEEVRQLLGKFGRLNAVRALLMAAGGIVGLYTALL